MHWIADSRIIDIVMKGRSSKVRRRRKPRRRREDGVKGDLF